ncbi:sensor domain-containing diguanylate cyclase [Sporosarcina sp. ACRSM]|uniref:diguanylate cyclase domain-containing protein n=1 Tax=Sporosarcina sp. ACRSM TaxID=2918216 RepID=UPI001EF614E1|nr:diguanylate cyclase [Sporosarcina sp. ACRSM]MCG7335640.1 sensor domain-containing diguanylate cyclase [Sporosarcina sp. ACRSM]
MNNSANELEPTIDEYQLIWENTHDAIFILRNDGAIIQANPALTDILGWQLGEVEGEARPPFFMEDFTVEDHQKQLDILRSGRSIANYETQRKHKNGTVKDVLASYRAINKGDLLAVAMYKDITDEKLAKHKLGVAEFCYRALVEHSPDAILVQNEEKLSFANPAAIQLLGAESLHQVIGKSIHDFIEPDDKRQFMEVFHDFEMVKTEPMIEQLVRFDGVKIWVEIIAIPITYDGEVVIQAIIRDITVRKYYEEQLTYMATHDPMTGVVNRSSFIVALDKAIEQANESEETFAVLYIDLDKFKNINDTLGHGVGDELLIQFAKRIGNKIRDRDIVGRVGGDEFLLLLRNIEKGKIKVIVNRMLENSNEPYLIRGNKIHSTSSIGIAMYPIDGKDSAKLIHNADQALYRAKEKRNHFEFYSE